MRAYVYILQFNDSGKYYVGSTSDLERRLGQHRRGHTASTKHRGFELVFSQEVDTLRVARDIEKRIKSWKRRDFIERIIEDGFIRSVKNMHP